MCLSALQLAEGGCPSVVNGSVTEVFSTNLAAAECRTKLSNKVVISSVVVAKVRMSSTKQNPASEGYVPKVGLSNLHSGIASSNARQDNRRFNAAGKDAKTVRQCDIHIKWLQIFCGRNVSAVAPYCVEGGF